MGFSDNECDWETSSEAELNDDSDNNSQGSGPLINAEEGVQVDDDKYSLDNNPGYSPMEIETWEYQLQDLQDITPTSSNPISANDYMEGGLTLRKCADGTIGVVYNGPPTFEALTAFLSHPRLMGCLPDWNPTPIKI